MAFTTRELLDFLGRDTLIRLIEQRGVTRSRENDERRKTLAHSYRGDIETLISDLTRQELIDVFRDAWFEDGGENVFLSNPAKYRHDELEAFAIRAFAGRRVRIAGEFTPYEPEELDDDDDDDWDQDDGEEDEDAAEEQGELSAAELLRVDSSAWSRPRGIGRIIMLLGGEEPQRLRTVRFRELIGALLEEGIEACLADDPEGRVLTTADESPGMFAKMRLRQRSSSAGHGIGRAGSAVMAGGPKIVVQAGEKPIPQQVARPSDYNLAVLRLQFLTAVPSVERGSLPAWPDGYLVAATRGLALRDPERSLLRAYAVGLCMGNHSPYDAIPRLTQVMSSSEWEVLLEDFQVLNPFQPELVRAIVEQLTPMTEPRTERGTWNGPPQAPADFLPSPVSAEGQPMAASARGAGSADTVKDSEPPNRRDLGALAGMFDDD